MDEQSALVSSHVRVESDGGSTSTSTDGTVVGQRSCRDTNLPLFLSSVAGLILTNLLITLNVTHLLHTTLILHTSYF